MSEQDVFESVLFGGWGQGGGCYKRSGAKILGASSSRQHFYKMANNIFSMIIAVLLLTYKNLFQSS